MDLQLIDTQIGFGGATPGHAETVTATQVIDEMRRLDISQALVRITPEALDSDLWLSNTKLYAACAEHPKRLIPCPVVVPNAALDAGPEEIQLSDHIRRGARAVCVRPQTDCWSLAPWVCDRLFQALEAHRLPTLCLMQNGFTLEEIGQLSARYPRVPLLFSVDTYRNLRTLLPLLRTFGNVHLLIGSIYTYHAGLEQLVAEVGAERLLFGTGFPAAEAMAAITQLTYADISAAARRQIGAENFTRLVQGVVA